MNWMRRLGAGLGAVVLAGAAVAQPQGDTWYGDLACSRALFVDAAKLFELKRKSRVTVRAIGTVSALEAVARGQVDVVGSARAADLDNAFEAGLEFTQVAWDSLALVTHPSNPVGGLSLSQLRDVYAGRVKQWSALGGAPKPINLYAVAGPDDGIEFSLRRTLFGGGNVPVAAQRWYINTKQLEDAIAIDPVALGVTTLSAAAGNKGLKILAIEGVTPSLATLESMRYLLPLPLYVAARRDAAGQTSTVSAARSALEFINAEPALRKALRARQVLPQADAVKLAAATDQREAQLAQMLGYDPAAIAALALAPPQPPAPAKGKQLNAVLRATLDPHAQRTALAPAEDAGAGRATRLGAAAETTPRVDGCRPASLCAGKSP
jgi:phosphate transport system substrate-binding protein